MSKPISSQVSKLSFPRGRTSSGRDQPLFAGVPGGLALVEWANGRGEPYSTSPRSRPATVVATSAVQLCRLTRAAAPRAVAPRSRRGPPGPKAQVVEPRWLAEKALTAVIQEA